MDHKCKTEMFIQSALDFKSGNVFTLQTVQEIAKKARIYKGMEAISVASHPLSIRPGSFLHVN